MLKIMVWNLFGCFGGNKSIKRNVAKGYMAKDKVHYSKAGYERQGELFLKLLNNLTNYINRQNNSESTFSIQNWFLEHVGNIDLETITKLVCL